MHDALLVNATLGQFSFPTEGGRLTGTPKSTFHPTREIIHYAIKETVEHGHLAHSTGPNLRIMIMPRLDFEANQSLESD